MRFYSTTGDGPGFRDIGLSHNPFNALVVPRPIGWISSVGANGQANLAPYSFFNTVCGNPPMVMFSSGQRGTSEWLDKDSLRNIRETRRFVVNMATAAQQVQMTNSSAAAPPEIDEFEAVGLEKLPGRTVDVPRVKGAPVHLECELERIVDLTDGGLRPGAVLAIGRVTGIHIDESVIDGDRVDIVRAVPIARLGYFEYCRVEQTFDIPTPKWPLEDRTG